MTINDYVKKYNYSFEQKPFNEVDNLVLSTLVYLNLHKYMGKNEKITIGELQKRYLKSDEPKTKQIFANKCACKLLENIETKRFKDIVLYNYVYESDDYSQFGAVTFDLGSTLYIAYEGTDELVSGWEEDFEMAYNFPVLAHKKAINYLKKYTFNTKKLILGGHSKGGNLALVAAMYSNFILKNKIQTIYSNDGQGLRKTEIESSKYKSIEDKYVHLIPQNSIVGLLFRHKNDVVVKSNALMLFSHIPSSLLIEDDHFIRTELVGPSKIFDEGMIKWLDKYNYEQRKYFVKETFNIFKENGIVSILELRTSYNKLIKVMKSSSKVSEETKEMFSDLLQIFNKIRKEKIVKIVNATKNIHFETENW